MKNKLQLAVQVIFLVLFLVLVGTGRVQLWMGLFLLGVVLALLLSRIYCGWICPINTVMNAVTWIKKILGIKGQKTPQALTRPWVRYLVFALFAATFAASMITGQQIPVLPMFFAIGVILTFFFPEALWHRYLCPYGTILALPAATAKYTMNIDQGKCTSCAICKKVCPADTVEVNDKKYTINKKECLVCLDCSSSCKEVAISYS